MGLGGKKSMWVGGLGRRSERQETLPYLGKVVLNQVRQGRRAALVAGL